MISGTKMATLVTGHQKDKEARKDGKPHYFQTEYMPMGPFMFGWFSSAKEAQTGNSGAQIELQLWPGRSK